MRGCALEINAESVVDKCTRPRSSSIEHRAEPTSGYACHKLGAPAQFPPALVDQYVV